MSRPQIVNGTMIGEYEAVGGIKIGGRNRRTRGKTTQCHFVHLKSHLGPNLGRNGKPATNRLSYGTASPISVEIHVEIQ
jgi:hypothetical protein